MRPSARKFVERLPGGHRILWLYRKFKFNFYFRFVKGSEDLFTDYYTRNVWGEDESVSGPGSTLAGTKKLRQELPKLLSKLEIKEILDAPCGDFNWFRLMVDELEIRYTGGDIVRPMVERNQQKYGNGTTRFVHLDITREPLPGADLWLCRDCLIHFSYRDIISALNNYLESGVPYLLTTTYPGTKKNKDIATGEVRELNLEIPPFNFPGAEYYIDDFADGIKERKLGLWSRNSIEEQIKALDK